MFRVCIGAILVFWGLFVQAEGSIDKSLYAKSAIYGLSGFLRFVTAQDDFISRLDPVEKSQLSLLANLMLEYEHLRFPKNGGLILPFPVPLEFSSDQKLFKRTPDEPVRSAITSDEKIDPIIFNTVALNRREIKFLDVVQILIHEMGHKLGSKKVQASVDSLAAKIRTYLERYYVERKGEDFEVQLFSIPAEVQRLRAYGENLEGTVQLFIEASSSLVQLADSKKFLEKFYLFETFTAHPQGLGNFQGNQTYIVRDVELLNSVDKIAMNLIVEVQSRLMFVSPNVGLNFGPVINGSQLMTPRFTQMDVIVPRVSIVKWPISVRRNLGDVQKVSVQQNLNPDNKWTYPRSSKPLLLDSLRKWSDVDETHLEISFNSEEISNLKKLAVEVNTNGTNYSYIIIGEKQGNKFIFKIPHKNLPATGAIVKHLIINGTHYYPLNEVIELPDNPERETSEKLISGSTTLLTDNERITYLPTLKIDMKDAPLVLSIPTNFIPIQVRLRWLKGVEISTNNKEQDKTPIGRVSDVHEEIFNPDTFTLKVDADGMVNVVLTSKEVHSPHSIQLIYPDMFDQQDIGLRLLKEVVFTSEDGQVIHLVQAPNLKIYNQEYLKVKPLLKCLPSIIH